MPISAENVIRSVYIPKGAGKGGVVSNSTTHEVDSDQLIRVDNFLVENGKWVPPFSLSEINPPITTGFGRPTSLHIFNLYTTSGVTPYIMAYLNDDGTGKGQVLSWAPSAWTARWSNLTSGNITPFRGLDRVVFQTAKNRLYMSNGFEAPQIWDGITATSYSWGVAGPVADLTYLISGGPSQSGAVGTATVTLGVVVTWTAGDNWRAVKPSQNQLIIFDSTNLATCETARIGTVTSDTVMNLTSVVANGVNRPFLAVPGSVSGTATFTNASPNVTWTAGDVFRAASAIQPAIIIQGTPIYANGKRYLVQSVTSPTALVLSTNFTDATGSYVFQANIGSISALGTLDINQGIGAGNAFTYGVGFWDQTTGHVSNCKTIDVKDGIPNNEKINVKISNIVPTGDTRFTKIILFRSPHGGSSLKTLRVFNNTGSAFAYVDDSNDDQKLGLDKTDPLNPIGLGSLLGPRLSNAPPDARLQYAVEWDGRFWAAINKPDSTGTLVYSGRPNDQLFLNIAGVTEESWPKIPDYFRLISQNDGRITGLRPVGNNLYVLTNNNIYQVIGNDPSNYQLTRVSSKGVGTSHFATAVLPGEDIGSGDVMVHQGSDGRLYLLYGGGADVPVSRPIQNLISSTLVPSPSLLDSTVGVLHRPQATYIIWMPQQTLLQDGLVYLYDIDRKIWSTATNLPAASYYEGLYGANQLMQLAGMSQSVGGPNIRVRQLFNTPSPASFYPYTVATWAVSPPDKVRRDEAMFQCVNLYVDDVLVPVHVWCRPDGPPQLYGTALFTNGSASVTWVSGDQFTSGNTDDLTVVVNGSPIDIINNSVVQNRATILTVNGSTLLTLTAAYTGQTGTFQFYITAGFELRQVDTSAGNKLSQESDYPGWRQYLPTGGPIRGKVFGITATILSGDILISGLNGKISKIEVVSSYDTEPSSRGATL